MTLAEKWNERPALRLLGAAVLNALFLALLLVFIAPAFESNDDLALAAFVDGQMAEKSARIPYISYPLALLLKGIYTVLGEGAAWHTVGQYTLLFISFTAVSLVLFERLRLWQGALVSIVLLLFFGVDSYTVISYTKTASVAAAAGMLLLFHAAEDRPKGKRALPAALGIALCLFGSMLRLMEFLPCAALMAALGFRWLWGLIAERGEGVREKLSRLWRYALPFAVMLAVVCAAYGADRLAWSQGRWGDYAEFDRVRVALTDYGIPEYASMPGEYDALELNENAVELFRTGNFFEMEKFGKDVMAELIRARQEVKGSPSAGECLGKLLDKCIPGFFVNLHIYAFLLIAALWLACGGHSLRDWATALLTGALFAVFYMYLIWRGRYMVDRVDMGLFFAMSLVLCRMLKKDAMSRERTVSLAVLCLALGLSYWLCRDEYRVTRHSEPESDDSHRAAVELILGDTEHLYLAKLDVISDTIYPPFEPAPAGYWDRIVLMGGWDFGHPVMLDTLAKYGVANPYRDIVGNDSVYMIEDDIDSTMEYIRDYYDPDASAELVEPISSETGLDIYRILGR